jgi:hypothetical protein
MTCQYFDVLSAHIQHLTDNFAIRQALADPKKSQELTEFVQDIVHSETSLLMREHNDVIQMQRNEMTTLHSEIDRLQRVRMDSIHAHAAEVLRLHGAHAAEVQSLHSDYTLRLRDALQQQQLSS